MLEPVRGSRAAVRAFGVAFLGLLLAVPMVVSAQTPTQYQVVADWPQSGGGRLASRYRGADVTGVGVDGQGRVFVCAGINPPVTVFDRSGNFLYTFGDNIMLEPHSVRFDPDGNLWIPDFERNQVFKFSPDGTLLASFGERNRKGNDSSHFNGPTDVAFGPNGHAYISDGYGNSRVVEMTRSGQFIRSWGSYGTSAGQFRTPHSVAVDAQGRVYVADRANRRIQIFTANGQFLAQWKLAGKQHPWSLFITPEQRLFMADGDTNHITVMNLNGSVLAKWGKYGRKPGQFREAHMLTVDTDGSVYVADASGKRVQKFTPVR